MNSDMEKLMEKIELLIADYKNELNNKDRLLDLYQKRVDTLEKEEKFLTRSFNMLGIVLLLFVIFNGILLIAFLSE
jgi:hypothetical protein